MPFFFDGGHEGVTSNVECLDRKDADCISQLYAYRTKEDAQVIYEELFKSDPKYVVCRMQIVSDQYRSPRKDKKRSHKELSDEQD